MPESKQAAGFVIGVIVLIFCIVAVMLVPELLPDIENDTKDLLTAGFIIIGIAAPFIGLIDQ